MGGFCCQVPPETPPYGANRKGLRTDHPTALRSEASLSIVVISNYKVWSGNGGAPPSENHYLYHARRSCFAPTDTFNYREERNWWRRRALPPGPQRLFRKAFITIAGEPARLM